MILIFKTAKTLAISFVNFLYVASAYQPLDKSGTKNISKPML